MGTTSASSPSSRAATTSSTPSTASTSPWLRLVRTSTTTITSFLGKVPWTETSSSTTPIGEGLCQPDPPCLTSTLLVYHMISVVIIMSIILTATFMRTTASLIYCLTVSSVFWPDVCYIKISADSNTFVLAPKCSKSFSIE